MYSHVLTNGNTWLTLHVSKRDYMHVQICDTSALKVRSTILRMEMLSILITYSTLVRLALGLGFSTLLIT